MSLTKAQLLARNHNKGNLLVSAGAGSGKTRVLTERVLRLILEENVPLSRLLILTFTNAAAQSMKEKIRKAFLQKGRIEEASLVDASYIMTFDAFSLALVKKYHVELGVLPTVGIYEEVLYRVQKSVVLQQIFEEHYQQETPSFLALLKQYVVTSDKELQAFILKVDEKADLKPDKEAFLNSYLDTYFSPGWVDDHVEEIHQWVKDQLQHLITLASQYNDEEEATTTVNMLQEVKQQATLDEVLDALKTFTLPRSKPKALDEASKAIKKVISDEMKSLKERALMYPIDEQALLYMKSRPYVETILSILDAMNERLHHQKRKMNRYPFADIAKMATSLLTQLGKKQEIQSMFDYIMIDEYQDTNDLQESFIQAIAKDNLFLVGDVKQSIYRFRNANSLIFSKKLETYTPYESSSTPHETVLAMNQNFRSRKEVIDDINGIFGRLMSLEYGGVDYTSSQSLAFGQVDYETHQRVDQNYHANYYYYEKSDVDARLDEAKIIAYDILDKIKNQWHVYDHEEKRSRPCSFQDFAILIDRKTTFDAYIQIFNEAGIPLEVYAERELSDSDFFRVFRNLVTCVVHFNQNDVASSLRHPFVSVLRSFLGKENDQALLDWTQGKRQLSSFEIYGKLETLASLYPTVSLRTWMKRCIEIFDLEKQLLSLPDMTANLARLEGLVQQIDRLTDLGMRLPEYDAFLRSADNLEMDLTIASGSNNNQAVRLMTIHKSKGLEFPIVYLPGLTKAFNKTETRSFYQYSQRYGIQLPYPEAMYPYPLFHDLIVFEEEQAILSEQIRLFYVALTRAQEKLIFIIEESKPRKEKEIEYFSSFADFLHFVHQGEQRVEDGHVRVEVPTEYPRLSNESQPISYPLTRKMGRMQRVERKAPLRASKVSQEEVNPDILAYGSYLHECLFLLDFKTMDVSFISNRSDQEKIRRITTLPFFMTLQEKVNQGTIQVLKEYAFIEPTTSRQGIIDLLLVEDGNVTILDYKTSSIEDEAYVRQVHVYADYIVSIGYSIQHVYLLSLSSGEFKEVPYSPHS
jgi:ATP-dependent helicase/nuclease subunit A